MDKKFLLFIVMFLFQAIGAFAFKNLSTLFVNNVHRLCFRITNQQQQPVTIRAGCMSCMRSALQNTLAGCLKGRTVLPEMIENEDAMCLIKACYEQIPGQVSLLNEQPRTRRRRSVRSVYVKQKA